MIFGRRIGEDEERPFVEHLEELRHRIIVSLVAIGIGTAISYAFVSKLIAILMWPLEGLVKELVFLNPVEAFMAQLKVSIASGAILSFPVWGYEFWAFVAPGLKKEERKYISRFFWASVFLFLMGTIFWYLLVSHLALRVLLLIGGTSLRPMLRVGDYLSFMSWMTLAFGIVFELPLILIFLTKAGITSVKGLRKKRKYAILGIFLAAAVITPTQDAVTMSLMAIPLILLYEASIWLSWLMGGRKE